MTKWEQEIYQPDHETVTILCGPMGLDIKAYKHGEPQIKTSLKAADKAVEYLERIACIGLELRQPSQAIELIPNDTLGKTMIESTLAVGDADLTPMAAVAGTLADAVADWLAGKGLTKVIVNNGGDIAIRLGAGEVTQVGVRSRLTCMDLSQILTLTDSSPSWGVTTSGLGGRSFTRGIASAVTVVAKTASIADAAATSIANACYVKDKNIAQVAAEQLDPQTDLKGIKVTTAVGLLSHNKKTIAVNSALTKAEKLCDKDLIHGALVAVDSCMAMTESMQSLVRPAN